MRFDVPFFLVFANLLLEIIVHIDFLLSTNMCRCIYHLLVIAHLAGRNVAGSTI